MQYHWLNHQNNDNLIIFFTGWSFDNKPFEFLDCGNYDVLIFFDYNDLNLPINLEKFSNYKKYYLISWSMGVYTAYKLRNQLPKFSKKIAINGTVYPVDNEYGIPEKPFLLTLKHVKTGLEGKFYQNIFNTKEEFEKYSKTQVERSIENRAEELKSLYTNIQSEDYDNFYDFSLISNNDKIIPTKNQINFWQKNYKLLESGHFPYYNFKSWEEILKCN